MGALTPPASESCLISVTSSIALFERHHETCCLLAAGCMLHLGFQITPGLTCRTLTPCSCVGASSARLGRATWRRKTQLSNGSLPTSSFSIQRFSCRFTFFACLLPLFHSHSSFDLELYRPTCPFLSIMVGHLDSHFLPSSLVSFSPWSSHTHLLY